MTTKHFQRPSDVYAGEVGLANRTKYQDDSNASPKRPISSIKVDGDLNALFDAVNVLYDTAVSGAVPDGAVTLPKFAAGTAGSALVFGAAGAAAYATAAGIGIPLTSTGAGTAPTFSQIKSAGIETAAVTNDKLSTDSVSTAKIQDGQVTNAKIGGGASATTYRTLIADTLGAVTWQPATYLDFSRLAYFRDEKANATPGGAAVGNTTQTRTLNTTVVNNIAGCSLATNQITLPVGTYWVEATTPGHGVSNHRARLYNTTTSAYIAEGTTEFVGTGSGSQSVISYVFTLAAQSVLELRHYFSGSASSGLGVQCNAGGIELYSQIKLYRLA